VTFTAACGWSLLRSAVVAIIGLIQIRLFGFTPKDER